MDSFIEDEMFFYTNKYISNLVVLCAINIEEKHNSITEQIMERKRLVVTFRGQKQIVPNVLYWQYFVRLA